MPNMKLTEAAYYGHRATVFKQNNLKSHHYFIQGIKAVEYKYYRMGRKRKFLRGKTVPLKTIFPFIKHVYDRHGVLIARRNAIGLPLKVTGKGMAKWIHLDRKIES